MKRRLIDGEDPPTGFEQLWLDAGTALLLPAAVVDAFRQQKLKQQVEDEARRQEERSQREQELGAQARPVKKSGSSKAKAQRKLLRAKPRPGWHRVLTHLGDFAKELEDAKALERSPDKDVNQRRRGILERLVELGPDRRIATPARWRDAVDELQKALPHFDAPIRALRNALALAEATGTAPRIPPQLLLGPPGVGKTFYSHRVAELFGSTHACVQFDQPSAGAQLRGSDKYWSNTEPGLLFNLICLGEYANPVILLDELDKACVGGSNRELNPLAQLHGALERETAQRLLDVSVDIEFDASLAVYVATANSLHGLGAPIVSRMQIFVIEPPSKWQAIDIATGVSRSVLGRLGLEGKVEFERRALYLMAHLNPRQMVRIAEQSVAAAVESGRRIVGETELWNELEDATAPRFH